MAFGAPAWIPVLLTIHLAATLFMTGLIWFVQVVHYPLFEGVGRPGFAAYERRHTVRTTWVVGPPMLIEGGTAVLLVWLAPAAVAPWARWTGLVLLAVIWISTAWLQVPEHRRLSDGFDAGAVRRLVAGNWLRTVGWSLRALLVLTAF